MISAFGVEHTISKSFKKLSPKLMKASFKLEGKPRPNGGWINENYAQWRGQAGRPGARSLADRAKDKEGARAMVTAAGNRSKRKGRVLP